MQREKRLSVIVRGWKPYDREVGDYFRVLHLVGADWQPYLDDIARIRFRYDGRDLILDSGLPEGSALRIRMFDHMLLSYRSGDQAVRCGIEPRDRIWPEKYIVDTVTYKNKHKRRA
jgi:hypothetical protein